jgi:hypothetical protein
MEDGTSALFNDLPDRSIQKFNIVELNCYLLYNTFDQNKQRHGHQDFT